MRYYYARGENAIYTEESCKSHSCKAPSTGAICNGYRRVWINSPRDHLSWTCSLSYFAKSLEFIGDFDDLQMAIGVISL